jgi:hypothetical protein
MSVPAHWRWGLAGGRDGGSTIPPSIRPESRDYDSGMSMSIEHHSVPGNGASDAKPFRLGKVGIRIDWVRWLRLIQRKRRMTARPDSPRVATPPSAYFTAATLSSFQLEGIPLKPMEVTQAVSHGAAGKGFRSRSSQRIRNHVAILRRIEKSLRAGATLTTQTVVRWYTSISCGLSLAALDETNMSRLDNVVRRINSPQFRLQPAITEIARVHAQLNADPLVPSFNGILARLLLQYHLGRCGLPRVLFDASADSTLLKDEPRLLKRILELVDSAYEMMQGGKRDGVA